MMLTRIKEWFLNTSLLTTVRMKANKHLENISFLFYIMLYNWFSTIFQPCKQKKLGKCQKCSEYFQCKIVNAPLSHCGKKVQFSKEFRADGAHISKIYNYFYIKNLVKTTTLCGNSNAWWINETMIF